MSGGGTSTNTVNNVPGWLQPFLTQSLVQGRNLENSGGPQMEQQVAPLNATQNAGISSIANAASGVNPAATASGQLNNIENGNYLLPQTNPYLQGTFNQGAQAVQNSLDSQFGAAGRNVIASAPVQADEMNNLATQLYGGAYNQGMQNMMQGAAMAPGIEQGQYIPGQELLGTGAGLQQQTQNVLNAQSNMYNYNQSLPYNTLSWYSSLVGQNANPFSNSSSTTQAERTPFQQGAGAVGGAAAGAELGSEIYPGWGTAIGAVGGGLMGAFG